MGLQAFFEVIGPACIEAAVFAAQYVNAGFIIELSVLLYGVELILTGLMGHTKQLLNKRKSNSKQPLP